MKYLKPYNEAAIDYLKPKSREEILKSIDSMTNSKKILFAIDYKLDWLIDEIIDNGVDDINYTVKKIILTRLLRNNKIDSTKKLLKIWNISLKYTSILDTIFRESIDKGNMELFKYLIELGVNIKKDNSNYIVMAANSNNLEMLKILFDNGVSTEYEPKWIKSIMLDDKYNEIIRFLSEKIPSIKNIIVDEYNQKQKELKILEKLL